MLRDVARWWRSRRGLVVGLALVAVVAAVVVGVRPRSASSPAPRGHVSTRRAVVRQQPSGPRVVTTVSHTSALVATAPSGVAVRRTPDGAPWRRLSPRTSLGSVRSLLVVARRDDGWLQVQLPSRPNHATGWVRASAVKVSSDPWAIDVNRRHRTLTLLRSGQVVHRYSAGIGAAATPTPTGLFYVTEKVTTGDPGGAFGPAALGLSAHSTVLHSFDGGDGIVGIHGTDADWSVGHPASNGCVRLHDSQVMSVYRRVPLGTPVRIS